MCNQTSKCVLALRAQTGDFHSWSSADAAPWPAAQTETFNQSVAGYYYYYYFFFTIETRMCTRDWENHTEWMISDQCLK